MKKNNSNLSTGLNFDLEHLIHIEQVILGSCLIVSSDEIKNLMLKHNVIPNDFWRNNHKEIYTAILQCWNANKPLDLITISEFRPKRFKENSLLNSANQWDYYNVELTQMISSPAHLEYHLMIFKEYIIAKFWNKVSASIDSINWNLRDKLEVSDNIINKYNDLYRRLTVNLTKESKENEYEHEITQKYLNNQAGISSSVSSGSIEINQLLNGGFYNGEFIVIAARPGMCKTTLALIMAWQTWKQEKNEVLFFSLEMPVNQLKSKIISYETGIDYLKIKKGNITSDELASISKFNKIIDESGFHIIGDLKFIDDILNKIRNYKKKKKVDIVYIDYIQLIKYLQLKVREGIMYITRELKSIAKECYIPVIALSQLSRAVESRPNKRPLLSDLKESGSIEEDADIVIFPYRQSYYAEKLNQTILENDKWKTEFTLGKARDGETKTIILDISPITLEISPYDNII